METHKIIIAFIVTIIAGLATGIGSLIAIIAKRTNKAFLCFSLGLSAGVMIYVSFMEMIPTAKQQLTDFFDNNTGQLYLVLAFFAGIALISLIDFIVPESGNPHELHGVEDMDQQDTLHRIGLVVAISLAIHNFPEGIATFASALGNLDIAIPIAVAIAIHNIPEGIAVAVPIYHATGNKKYAFWASFMSGLAEPLGATIAFIFLMPYWNPLINSIVLAMVSGIMVFISIDELLPSAQKYGQHHVAIIGVIAGMAIMALSLFLL